jgi:glucose/arabinose dehydrogenase
VLRFRKSIVSVLAATALLATTAGVASAVHDDIIPEKIQASDAQIALETVATGLTTPVLGTHAPGDNDRLIVVDQIGKLWAIDIDDDDDVPDQLELLDVGAGGLGLLVPLGAFGPGTFDERGFLSVAFHPDYPKNGKLYTFTSEPAGMAATFQLPPGVEANHQSVITEWTVNDPKDLDSVVDTGSRRPIIRIDNPQFNHNSGQLAFGPDDLLYIGVGDGGGRDDEGPGHSEGGNGQDITNVLGTILRIDVDGSNSNNGQYGVPRSNPFAGQNGVAEIFAYGFRNPYRFSFDADDGALYAADVGQGDVEEVDLVVAGGNYGWPVKEGSFLFDGMGLGVDGIATINSPGQPAGLIDPIAQYDHDEGVSITGGFVYSDSEVGDIRGMYVFGDYTQSFSGPNGRLFGIDADGGDIEELLPAGQDGVGLFISGFGQDRDGQVYVLGTQNVPPVGETGVVQRIVEVDDDDDDRDDDD